MSKIIFITGTDTGAGKTLLTALMLVHFRRQGRKAWAMKPFTSGPCAADVRLLYELQEREIHVDLLAPFRFGKPLAPMVAARFEAARVDQEQAIERISWLANRCDLLLVEGTGGLLTPLGDGFCLIDLIPRLRPSIWIAGRNKLGVLNHCLLTSRVLESVEAARSTRVVLMGTGKPDLSTMTNRLILNELLLNVPIDELPFIGRNAKRVGVVKQWTGRLKKTLARIAQDTLF